MKRAYPRCFDRDMIKKLYIYGFCECCNKEMYNHSWIIMGANYTVIDCSNKAVKEFMRMR